MPLRHGVFSFSQTLRMSTSLPFPPCFSHYIAILLIYQGKTTNPFQNMPLDIKAKALTPYLVRIVYDAQKCSEKLAKTSRGTPLSTHNENAS